MDFSLDINKLFREPITLIDNRLQPCRQHGIDRYGFQQLQKMLYEVVDKMGDASARAQGLHGPITTGKKLELANHHLYLMTDSNGNNGKGSALGILKVGRKKLFVYDNLKVQHELEPLCVLDFYVHESRQRMGCGRRLFDFMLSRENICAEHLAVDRPSPKFLSFLKKHYGLDHTIPQVNNFVIFENFFNNRKDSRKGRRNMESGGFIDRASPVQPNSGKRVAALGYNSHSQIQPHPYENGRQQHNLSVERSWTPSMARQSPSHLGAGEMMYSRHRTTPPQSGHGTPNRNRHGSRTPTQGFYPQPQQQQRQNHFDQQQQKGYQNYQQQQQQQDYNPYQQQQHHRQLNNTNKGTPDNSVSFYKQLNAQSSPSTYYNMGTSLGGYQHGGLGQGLNTLEHLPPKAPTPNQRQVQTVSLVSSPGLTNRGKVEGSVPPTPPDHSLHTNRNPSPSHGAAGRAGSGNHYTSPQSQPCNPVISAGSRTEPPLKLPAPSSASQQENIAHRPPSGKKSGSSLHRASQQPPLLPREGPPANYKDMLNMHQAYQGRNGRLNVPLGPSAGQGNSSAFARADAQNSSWTVGGVLREQRLNAPVSNRYYNPTRLW
ncbi:hypothetical protein EGW08_009159 [Elysia chlorotica]|uniref:Alpha-tubulin N-acetyltransferase n=1 Tax=Elysia chlorotica TaxID=188477 RepID=A0A3S0ZUG4_ELYCH|nr:hypothetical protein EGW08_009159 [Elysia chlorotica]